MGPGLVSHYAGILLRIGSNPERKQRRFSCGVAFSESLNPKWYSRLDLLDVAAAPVEPLGQPQHRPAPEQRDKRYREGDGTKHQELYPGAAAGAAMPTHLADHG